MRFATLVFAGVLLAHAEDTGVLRKLSENKFAPLPVMPPCVTMAVESGDPAKGASVIVFKGTAGCMIPWHWHTPTEQVMIVSGSAKVEMKDHGSAVLGPGGFAMMPSKHVHQFTCTSACTAFVASDKAFDIHYVDSAGKEVPVESALAKPKK
jgi:quercetin dioxygenase-like cupin family protein